MQTYVCLLVQAMAGAPNMLTVSSFGTHWHIKPSSPILLALQFHHYAQEAPGTTVRARFAILVPSNICHVSYY